MTTTNSDTQLRSSSPARLAGRPIAWCVAFVVAWAWLPHTSYAAGQPDSQEQAAFEAAAARVAPSVVRIDTIGGLEQVDGMLVGTGPTTGTIVAPDGWIISSAFNFINKPTSILVRLPDGHRKSAKLVATDHSRKLVLLKVETDKPLPVCEMAKQSDMRVGQWVIAVGRTFESERPNITIGILSAMNRVWGKALQTDAAISPNNYGGSLIDIHGRVMGVIVPLSPSSTEEMGGIEWYDSGIGFAVPMEQIQKMLPRLEKGEELHSGIAGISIKSSNPITGEAIVGACHPKSSAAAEGLKPGDKIIEIGGHAIRRAADFKTELGRYYAGDKVTIAVLRGADRLERQLTLAEKLEPYQHGFLGILPERTPSTAGVVVRYVYPDSPAAKAGLKIGDVITTLGKEPIADRLTLLAKIGTMEPGTKINFTITREGKSQELTATLTHLPDGLPPADLPSPRSESKPGKTSPATGAMAMKIPEYPNEIWAYVPKSYNDNMPYGVVVLLQKPGNFDWKEILARWAPICDRHDLILVAPKSGNPNFWTPDEAALVERLLVEVDSTYNVDPARIVAHGVETGGTLAAIAAFRHRESIRGVAIVEGALMGAPPDNDPLHRLAVYLAWSKKSPASRAMPRTTKAIRQMKIPLATQDLGETSRYLNREELAELARWIDTLDRI